MHFTIYFYILYNLVAIGLQPAVHIMKFDSGNAAGCSIVQFAREVLGQDIVFAVLFPSGNHIVTIFLDHLVEGRNLIRAVL